MVATQAPSREDILFKQSQLAERRKKNSPEPQLHIVYNKKKDKKQSQNKNTGGFFGSSLVQANGALKNLDADAILNAKSRFASEADAEAYAESRKRVTELEQEEARKEQKKQKKSTATIQLEWVCRTCNNKRSQYEPKQCIRARHQVTRKRILNKTEVSKSEKRTKLTAKSAQEGGLVLGSGIEWTQIKSSRFS